MHTDMSVPEAVHEVLASNHTYSHAIELSIANYTALAEKIKQEIEKLIGAAVGLHTIVFATKRFADNLGDKNHNNKSANNQKTKTKNVADIQLNRHRLSKILMIT